MFKDNTGYPIVEPAHMVMFFFFFIISCSFRMQTPFLIFYFPDLIYLFEPLKLHSYLFATVWSSSYYFRSCLVMF